MPRGCLSEAEVRVLGRETEYRVLEGLLQAGIQARHATKAEDISGWDLEVAFRGICVRVDVTISKTRFAEKQASDQCRNRQVVPVLVDPGSSAEELARETMRQVVYSLNGSLVSELLQGRAGEGRKTSKKLTHFSRVHLTWREILREAFEVRWAEDS